MSILTVTNINTANGSTDLSISTGNTSGASMVLWANGNGINFRSNSSTNAFSVGPSGVTFTNASFVVANLQVTTNVATIGTAAYYVANGNIGIANASPTHKLSVNGNTYIANSVTIAGPVSLSGSPFYEATATITADYTITTNYNAFSPGPIAINSGVTVTVPSGSTWTVS